MWRKRRLQKHLYEAISCGSLITRTPQCPSAALPCCTGGHDAGASGREQMLSRAQRATGKTPVSCLTLMAVRLTWRAHHLLKQRARNSLLLIHSLPIPKQFFLPGMMTSGNPNFLVIANPLLNIMGFSLRICSMSPRKSCREIIRPTKTRQFFNSEPHIYPVHSNRKDIKFDLFPFLLPQY